MDGCLFYNPNQRVVVAPVGGVRGDLDRQRFSYRYASNLYAAEEVFASEIRIEFVETRFRALISLP